MYYCAICDKEISGNAYAYIEGEEVCEACFARADVCRCVCCEEWTYRHNMYNEDVCFRCFEEHYITCSSCGDLISNNDYYVLAGETLCECCYNEQMNNIILPYSFKPMWHFRRGENDSRIGNLYFGIELEYSFPYISDRDVAAIDVHRLIAPTETGVLKHDGSLYNGFEFVSHPATLNWWTTDDTRSLLLRIMSHIIPACDREFPDGMHIHLSKKGMSAGHRVRFGTFFNRYKEQFIVLAERESETYAAYKDAVPETGAAAIDCACCSDRYEAVNWDPTATVEIRIFRATADVHKILARIELCHAAYQYTKTSSITRILDDRAWPEFIKFIRAEPRYKDLPGYMRDLNLM